MLRINAGLEDYHEYYRLSNKNYYYDLHLEEDATTEQIKTAFKELGLRLHPDKNDGDERAKDAFKRIRTAYEVLDDPIRRTQYDNDLRVKVLHFNGQVIGSKMSEDARFEEIRSWSYQEGERQRAKERAERREREQARFEVDQEEVQSLELEMEIDRRQAELESLRQQQQAKEEKSEEYRLSRSGGQKTKGVRKVKAEAERQGLFEQREKVRKRAADERDMGKKGRLAAARKQKQETLENNEAEESATTQERTPRVAKRRGGRGRRK